MELYTQSNVDTLNINEDATNTQSNNQELKMSGVDQSCIGVFAQPKLLISGYSAKKQHGTVYLHVST